VSDILHLHRAAFLPINLLCNSRNLPLHRVLYPVQTMAK